MAAGGNSESRLGGASEEDFHMSKISQLRVERLPEVMARVGMGRSWIYKQIAVGAFPAPIKIGRASGWRSTDIDRWLERVLSTNQASADWEA